MKPLALLPLLAASATTLAATFNETEPNDSKATANALSLAPGDIVAGTSTGSSATVPGVGSIDYFRLGFAAAAPGIYLNTLTLNAQASGAFLGQIVGFTQTNGVVNPDQITAQVSSINETNNDRVNRFYSFGAPFTVNYSVSGSASTTNPYAATYTRTAVAPVALGALSAGNVVISTAAGNVDSELALYDANFNLVAQNDDEISSTNTVGTSRIAANLAPGTYTLAVSNINLATNAPSDANDAFRGGNVLDGPGFVLNSSSGQNLSIPVAFTDAAGASLSATYLKTNKYGVGFYSFTVAQPVPEPATLAALGFGAAALLRRRRKSA